MADDSETEVFFGHQERSEEALIDENEQGQGDMNLNQDKDESDIEPRMERSRDDYGAECNPMGLECHVEKPVSKKAGLPVKPEPYSGSEDWEEYISHFTLCAELGRWTEQEKVLALAASLRGPARTFYISLSIAEKYSYTTLVKELSQRFGSLRQQSRWLSRLEGRKRKPEESMAALGDDLRQMSQRAYPNLDGMAQEALALNQLYKCISLEMKCRCIDRNCSTVAQAVDIIERYESILGDGADKRRAVRMVDGDRQKPDNEISRTLQTILSRLEQLEQGPYQEKGQQRESGQSKYRCYGCGSPHHFIRQCPARNANSTNQGGADTQTKKKSGNSYPPSH